MNPIKSKIPRRRRSIAEIITVGQAWDKFGVQDKTFQPKGTKFYSQTLRCEMILVSEGDWKDWICYKHQDGQWVSYRKATRQDIADLANAISKAHHS